MISGLADAHGLPRLQAEVTGRSVVLRAEVTPSRRVGRALRAGDLLREALSRSGRW